MPKAFSLSFPSSRFRLFSLYFYILTFTHSLTHSLSLPLSLSFSLAKENIMSYHKLRARENRKFLIFEDYIDWLCLWKGITVMWDNERNYESSFWAAMYNNIYYACWNSCESGWLMLVALNFIFTFASFAVCLPLIWTLHKSLPSRSGILCTLTQKNLQLFFEWKFT